MTKLPRSFLERGDGESNQQIATLDELTDAWLSELEGDVSQNKNGPAVEIVLGLSSSPNDHALCWAFISAVIQKTTTKHQIGMVAAGPLENLIVSSGAEYIDQIEAAARQSVRFRYTLTGVWPQDTRESDIWHRVETARAPIMSRGIDSGADIPLADLP